jgi:site-specific DNA-methyltransferase (adenine-specific)
MSLLNHVYNEDCMDGLRAWGEPFDLAIVDPPYGIDVANMAYLKEKKKTVKQKNGNRLNPATQKIDYQLKDWDKAAPPQEYYDLLCKASKHQIIFGIDYMDWDVKPAGRIVWDKCVPDSLSFKGKEVAYASMIPEGITVTIKLLWSGMMQAKSLKEPTTQQGNKKLNEKRIHPCHKPRLLYRKLLQDYARGGDWILDTHVGGGSIRIEADLRGCNFLGFEIDKDYWKRQEDRYPNYKKQLRLF